MKNFPVLLRPGDRGEALDFVKKGTMKTVKIKSYTNQKAPAIHTIVCHTWLP